MVERPVSKIGCEGECLGQPEEPIPLASWSPRAVSSVKPRSLTQAREDPDAREGVTEPRAVAGRHGVSQLRSCRLAANRTDCPSVRLLEMDRRMGSRQTEQGRKLGRDYLTESRCLLYVAGGVVEKIGEV